VNDQAGDPAIEEWRRALLPDDLLDEWENRARDRFGASAVPGVFRACLARTMRSLTPLSGGRVAVITGDIPAMWLRDSSTQLWPYLTMAAGDPAGPLSDALVGVALHQQELIAHDPYANAFNVFRDDADPPKRNPSRHRRDRWGDHHADPLIWERKYEVDSLCFPIQLTARMVEITGRQDLLGDRFEAVARAAFRTLRIEQDHEERSDYRFVRPHGDGLSRLARNGFGSPVAKTGLTWSAFRPSDDACTYGYNVPANLHAAAALQDLARLWEMRGSQDAKEPNLAADALALSAELRSAVVRCGVVQYGDLGEIMAYEVNGFGDQLLMDDANLPSLLGLPLVAGGGYGDYEDPLYRSTRAFVLSQRNPTYTAGSVLSGIGSPHTRKGWVWPVALATQGLTTADLDARIGLVETMARTTAGTGHMHESINADDDRRFTRPWFCWADAMFCLLVLAVIAPDEVIMPARGLSG
jgi:meiotically up-regulated gene 157 (Mug157) protein